MIEISCTDISPFTTQEGEDLGTAKFEVRVNSKVWLSFAMTVEGDTDEKIAWNAYAGARERLVDLVGVINERMDRICPPAGEFIPPVKALPPGS